MQGKGQDGHGPLYKLCGISNGLSEYFLELYNPNRKLSIDDSRIGTTC